MIHPLMAAGTAAGLTLLLGYLFISFFPSITRSQVREYTPSGHQKKNNTPTMGGLFFLAAAFIVLLIFGHKSDVRIWVILFAGISFAVIGFFDDWAKIKHKRGISARLKFILQWACAGMASFALVHFSGVQTSIQVPLVCLKLEVGPFYYLWASFIMVACSNAVNLTDGLDGLASITVLPNVILWACMAGVIGWSNGAIAAAALAGCLIGFLWFNKYPARVFMGDVGALSIGALYALLALMLKQELLIVVAGIVLLIEELSVMLQVASFKLRGKRIFKMAPVHHHFELSGIDEQKITLLFGLVATIASIIAYLIFISCH